MLAVALCGPARASAPLLAPGDAVREWTVAEVEGHPEYVRYFFDGPGGATGVEIVADPEPASDWRTGRHRLMPAPGHEPPPELLEAVMQRLRERDAVETTALPATAPKTERPSPSGLALLLGAVAGAAAAILPVRQRLDPLVQAIERRPWLPLLAVLAAVLVPRLLHLDQPFDADAATQRIYFATLDPLDIAAHRYADARHPPLFYLVLHAFLGLGATEAVARLPAILFSVLAAASTFALARPLVGAARALIAPALIALDLAFLEHGRDVSDVSLFLFLAVLSSHLLLRTLDRPTPGRLVALGLAEAAMLHAYYLSAVVAGAHALVAVLHARGEARRPVWTGLGVAWLLALPVWSDLLDLVGSDRGMRETARVHPTHLWGDTDVPALLDGLVALFAPGAAAAVLGALLVVAGLVRLRRQPAGTLLGAVLVSGGAAAVLAVEVVRIKPYYFLYLLPFLAVAAVVGSRGGRGLGTAALIAFAAAAGVQTWRGAPEILWPEADSGRTAWRDLAGAIRAEGAPDRVVADPDSAHTIALWYVFRDDGTLYRRGTRGGPEASVACEADGRGIVTLTSMPYLHPGWEARSVERLAAVERPFWFVHSSRFPNAPLHAAVRETCAAGGAYGDLELYRCP